MAKAKKAKTPDLNKDRVLGHDIGMGLIDQYKEASPHKQLKRLGKDYRRCRESLFDSDVPPERKAQDIAIMGVLRPRILELMAQSLLKEATRAFTV